MVKKYQNKRQKLREKDYQKILELKETGEYTNEEIGHIMNISGSHVGKILRSNTSQNDGPGT